MTFDLGGGREFRGVGSPRYASISNVTTDEISNNQANFRYKDNWDNAAKAKGLDTSASADFDDYDRSYDTSYDTAIGYAYATGLLTGKDGGNFAGVDT